MTEHTRHHDVVSALHCTRCGLHLQVVSPYPVFGVCPRCRTHDHVIAHFGLHGLSVGCRLTSRVAHVTLEGEADIASLVLLECALDRARRLGRVRTLVDLGGLAFIDSTGVRALLRAHHQALRHGQELVLRVDRASVPRAFTASPAGASLRILHAGGHADGHGSRSRVARPSSPPCREGRRHRPTRLRPA